MNEKDIKENPTVFCRVCLETHSEMFELFENEKDYGRILQECGRVTVEKDDGLPMVICQYCVKELMQAHAFIIKCQTGDKKLRSALSSPYKHENIDDKANKDDGLFNLLIDGSSQYLDIKTEVDMFVPDMDVVDDSMDDRENCIKDEEEEMKKENPAPTVCQRKKKKNLKGKKKCKKSEGYPKKCSYCDTMLSCKSVLLIHTRSHTNDRPFQCYECEQCFKAKSVFKTHLRRCHMKDYQKTHKCLECHKYFYCRTELRVHMRSHTGDTPYNCKLCRKSYTQSASLKRHVRSCHTGERPYQCSKCPKNFVTLQELRKHDVIHSDERNYVCNICNNAFKCKGTLRVHIKTHSKVKSFVCDQCGITFRTKSNLLIHQNKIHSELSGRCTVCNKEFTNLSDHMPKHTGETPFQCEECGKKFSMKASYLIHVQIHKSDRYPCKYRGCNKTYPKINFLEYHVLKHHKKFTPYVCNYCEKGYFRFCDIKIHMKVNHSDKDMTQLKKIEIPSSFFVDP